MEEERNENPNNISRGDKLNMSKISRQIQKTGRRCIWMHERERNHEKETHALCFGERSGERNLTILLEGGGVAKG